MTTSRLSKILFSVVVLFYLNLEVNCVIEEFALRFTEEGTTVREEVDIDVESKTEVIRVPAHNNKGPMDVMNDFNAGLTTRRLPLSKVCYVSKLDPTLPTPRKLKLDMELARKQPMTNEKIIKETAISVLGFADRLSLPQKILDFCGSLPIYDVEDVSVEAMNATLYSVQGMTRQKRHSLSSKSSCTNSQRARLEYCLDMQGDIESYNCDWSTGNCYYILSCTRDSGSGHRCSYSGHVTRSYCCYYRCA